MPVIKLLKERMTMGLHFILGRAGSGKTTRCCRDIVQFRQNHPDQTLFFIVPDQSTYTAERTLAETFPGRGFADIFVVGFSRLAYRIFRELHTDLGDALSPLGQQLILRRLLSSGADSFQVLATAARQTHFSASAAAFFHEMESYDISEKKLSEAALSENDTALGAKLHDLSLLYSAYRNYLKAHFAYQGSLYEVLTREIPHSQKIRQSCIWVDGFNGMTPQELTLLSALIQTARDVTVTLPMGRPEEAALSGSLFERPYHMWEELTHRFGSSSAEILDHSYRFLQPVLKSLEKDYFALPARPCTVPPDGLTLQPASDRTAEADAAARQILAFVRDNGFRWRDILVLLRKPDNYADLLERTFKRYEIPCFIDSRRSMWNHPLVVLLDSLIRFLAAGPRGWSRHTLFRLLKTGLLPEFTDDEIDRLENYVLRFHIRHYQWNIPWHFHIPSDLDADTNEPTPEETRENQFMEELRLRLTNLLDPLMKSWEAARTGREKCTVLYEWMTERKIPDRLAEWEKEESRPADRGTQSQVWKKVLALLDELVHVSGDDTLSPEDFLSMAEDGLSSLTFSLIPPTLDHVTVTSIDRGYALEGRAVFILGANEGEFPFRIEEQGLLTDQEREHLNRKNFLLGPDLLFRTYQEQFYIYLALTRAREYLTVSYAETDTDGSDLEPSFILARLQSLHYGYTAVRASAPGPDTEDPSFIARPSQALALLPAMLRRPPVSSLWQSLFLWAENQPEWKEKIRRILGSLTWENRADRLPPDIARALFMPSGKFRGSVTQLEQYRSCPYSYFLKYGMHLQERNDGRMNSADYGSYLHAGLHLFGELFQKQKKQWRDASEEDISRLSGSISETLAPKVKNGALLSDAAGRYIRHSLDRTFRSALERICTWSRQSGFQTEALEKSFAVDLPGGDGNCFTLVGKIDRIDRQGNALAIYDYKTGRPTLSLNEICSGQRLQLVTYLIALLAMEEKREGRSVSIPAALLYLYISDEAHRLPAPLAPGEIPPKDQPSSGYFLRDTALLNKLDSEAGTENSFIHIRFGKDGAPMNSSPVLSPEEMKALLCAVSDLLRRLYRSAASGRIPITPILYKKAAPCRYCPYRSICRFDPRLPENTYEIIPARKDSDIKADLASCAQKQQKGDNIHD